MSSGHPVIRPGPLALSVNLDNTRMYLFDGKGRLVHTHRDGTPFRRSLDNRLLEQQLRQFHCGTLRTERELAPADRDAFYAQLQEELADVRAALRRRRAIVEGGPWAQTIACQWLDRALAWKCESLEADGKRFRQIYRYPVVFLPPERQLSVVLQLTEGCVHNRCSLSGLLSNRPFRVKGPAEFQRHAWEVRDFLGEDPLRRGIFLADADALVLPVPRLREYLSTARAFFPWAVEGAGGGFYSFLDDVYTWGKGWPDHWGELASQGLRRVYLGVGTGDRDLLQSMARPASPVDLRELVAHLHANGIAVGVLVTAGLGGDPWAAAHTESTVELIRCLGLRRGDFLHIADVEPPPAAHQEDPDDSIGGKIASPLQVVAQMRAFCQAALGPSVSHPRVSMSSLTGFRY